MSHNEIDWISTLKQWEVCRNDPNSHPMHNSAVFGSVFRTTILQQQQESAIDIALPFITFYVTFQKIVSIRNSDCNFTLLRLLIVL